MAKRGKSRKQMAQLSKVVNRKPIDWTEDLDSSNFIRSVLAPSTYGEEIATYDDFEVREFCRKHSLHSDTDIIQFAIENTEFTLEGLFGL